MNKKIIKDALILFVITLVAGFGLGAVHGITEEPIAQANYNIQQNAYKTVFADAAEFVDLDGFSAEEATAVVAEAGFPDSIDGCVQAMSSDGTLLGYVITVADPNGYGGTIRLSIGVTLDGTLNGYSITEISETAGLGMKSREEAFSSQYSGKQVEAFTVTKTGVQSEDQIDAISGATITSKAVTSAVNAGLTYYRAIAQ